MNNGFGKFSSYFLFGTLGVSAFFLYKGEPLNALHVLAVAILLVLVFMCSFIIDIANDMYEIRVASALYRAKNKGS